MLVGVEAPVIAYSETVTDMIVEGKAARLLLYQFFDSLSQGGSFVFSNGLHSARGATGIISTVCHLL